MRGRVAPFEAIVSSSRQLEVGLTQDWAGARPTSELGGAGRAIERSVVRAQILQQPRKL